MERLNEGVEVRRLPAAARDAELGRLEAPWVAHEGPLAAELHRGLPARLLPRGLAFDAEATVWWDEAGVVVARSAAAEPGTFARREPVVLRDRFPAAGRFFRVDYLRRGCLLASRFVCEGDDHA